MPLAFWPGRDAPGGPTASARRRRKRRVPARPSTQFVVLTLWAIVTAVPFLWMVITAFKADGQIFSSPWSLPDPWHPENFLRAWDSGRIGTYLVNSLVVSSCALLLTMVVATHAAYIFARYSFPARRTLYYFLLVGMVFPLFLAIVPLFFVLRGLGLLGTHLGVIMVYAAYWLPFNVFFLTSFFRTIPTELAEAAFVDGAGHFGVFYRVMLPLAAPGILTMAIFTFIGQWNEFLLPLVLLTKEKDFLVPQGMAALSVSQNFQTDWSGLFAGLVLATIPTLIAYTFFSSRIQRGLTAGALKG